MNFISTLAFLSLMIFSRICGMEQPIAQPITWHQFNTAVLENNSRIVAQFLKQKKPDPEQLVRSFHTALNHDAIGAVALLLRYGVPVNEPYRKNSSPPLLKMVKKGNIQMVEWLRIFRADRYIEDKHKMNSLEIAYHKHERMPKIMRSVIHTIKYFAYYTIHMV